MGLTVPQILVPWATGIAASSYLVRLWGGVKAGFSRIADLSAAVILIIAVFAGPGGIHQIARGDAEPAWLVSATVLAAAAAVSLMASLFLSSGGHRRDVVGIGSESRRVQLAAVGEVAAVILGLLSCVGLGLSRQDPSVGVARAFASVPFLGASTSTMLLGHWYLVDPKMPREAIRRLAGIYLVSVPVEVAALALPQGIVGAFGVERTGIGGYLPPFWVALVVTCLVFAVLVLAALKERGYAGVMAATGLSYLTIMSSFGVDVIGKALIAG